jgi:hypothetical protein
VIAAPPKSPAAAQVSLQIDVLYAATVAGEFEQIGALRLNGNLVALPSPLNSLQARRY